MSIQRPSCFFNLCSSCSSRSNKRRRDCLLPPPRGRLCCRAGLTAPPYSHRWPSHPSTHPHLLLFSGDGRRTSKPSYSPPHRQPLPSLPRLCVVPWGASGKLRPPRVLSYNWGGGGMTGAAGRIINAQRIWTFSFIVFRRLGASEWHSMSSIFIDRIIREL